MSLAKQFIIPRKLRDMIINLQKSSAPPAEKFIFGDFIYIPQPQ